jgi:ClpP class serine protease
MLFFKVLGLTASLGVKKATHTDMAMKHILTMCANLDAQVLSYPDEEMKKEIEKFANTAKMSKSTESSASS